MLADGTEMRSPPGQQNSANWRATDETWLASSQVDPMFELKKTSHAVGVHVIRDRIRTACEQKTAVRAKTAVLGAQWGDEGKGKIVDVLSEQFAVVARYAGGHNAGHTVIIGGPEVCAAADSLRRAAA
jgi:hypothetical protein